MAQGDLDHLVGRSHFQIERQIRRGLDSLQILVTNVAAIFTQVSGDSVSANARHDLRGSHRVGMFATPRIADGGDVINVDAQPQPWTLQVSWH